MESCPKIVVSQVKDYILVSSKKRRGRVLSSRSSRRRIGTRIRKIMGRNAVNRHTRNKKKSKAQIKRKGYFSRSAYSLGKKERSLQKKENKQKDNEERLNRGNIVDNNLNPSQ